ncbi:MAG: hypothetical protein AB1505_23445 [Candidatus Latescibacterota bacterium]
MAFTVHDFQDMVDLLDQHPEWQAELRRRLLADDLLALPSTVRRLAESQERLAARVEQLAEAQQRTEARLEQLAAAQQRTEARLEQLVEAQQRTEARLEQLAQAQQRTEEALGVLSNRQDQMRGDLVEFRYAQRAAAYFGRLLRRLRTVLPGQLDPAVEDNLEARLTHEELVEVLQLDVLAVGRLRGAPTPEAGEVWLAVEVSAVIDRGDVERVERRTALLRKAGYRVVPVVAGEGLTQGATRLLQDVPVALVLDGRSQGWEEALAAA